MRRRSPDNTCPCPVKVVTKSGSPTLGLKPQGIYCRRLGAVAEGLAKEACVYVDRRPRNSLRGTTDGVPHANRFNGFCFCCLGRRASHG